MNRKASAYNFRMRFSRFSFGLVVMVSVLHVRAQEAPPEQLSILTKDLPAASLWSRYESEGRYGFSLRATGGVGAHRWRIVAGALPRGLTLEQSGLLVGAPEEIGDFEWTAQLTDGRDQVQRRFTLTVETPLRADWLKKSRVTGNRVGGSIQVSNTTGRDFDLTFVVLAVNEAGRATAIGYQHFPLKRNTRDLELPFGDTLSPGSYVVNIDVVGEEPVSKMIFRARLVAPKQVVAPTL